MAKTIAMTNFKGGVGKTTSTLNIGAAMARSGKKVLLIDIDPQFNLTQSLGVTSPEYTIYDTLHEGSKLKPLLIKDNLDLIPSDLRLIKADMELSNEFERDYILDRLIKPLKNNYDYIIIDCPPTIGLLTVNSYATADLIFTPIEAEFLSLKGFTVLSDAIKKVRKEINHVFITKYDQRKNLNKEVMEAIRSNLSDKMLGTFIRTNVALAEAPVKGQDIFEYAPKSNGALDYSNLAGDILNLYN